MVPRHAMRKKVKGSACVAGSCPICIPGQLSAKTGDLMLFNRTSWDEKRKGKKNEGKARGDGTK